MGRSRGVLGRPDYFCLGAVPRNGGGKRKERMFQSRANKDKASDERKNSNNERKSSTTKEQHNQ